MPVGGLEVFIYYFFFLMDGKNKTNNIVKNNLLILKFITITITIILAVLSVSVHFKTLMLIVTFPILQELNIPEVLDNIFVCDKVCVCDFEGELS